MLYILAKLLIQAPIVLSVLPPYCYCVGPQISVGQYVTTPRKVRVAVTVIINGFTVMCSVNMYVLVWSIV